MRIVSRQKDYYDGVMAHGMDLELLYIRDSREEEVKGASPLMGCYTGPFPHRMHVVGFCGNVYPVVEVGTRDSLMRERVTVGDIGAQPKPECMFHDFAHIDAFFRANLKDKELESYDGKKRYANFTKVWWEKFYVAWDARKGKFNHLFEQGHAPIFVISEDHKIRKDETKFWDWKQGIVFNPLLKPFNFAKVKDPYTAFQDIRMWLSNQAAPEKPIPKMSNDENAERLGHGGKYSFRKPPSK